MRVVIFGYFGTLTDPDGPKGQHRQRRRVRVIGQVSDRCLADPPVRVAAGYDQVQ